LPRFLDAHPMKGVTEDMLRQVQMSPKMNLVLLM
jgi:hypothetical protein